MDKVFDLTNDELWQQVQRNDKAAFERLYRKMAVLMINQGYKILKDEARAKDIVQDIFINVYINRNKIPSNTNITGYLLNAVKYKVSNVLRDEMRKENVVAEMAGTVTEYNTYVFESYQQKELQQLINRSIDNLPEKCRHAFQLNFYNSLSYRLVALKMGISVKTVEKHISKALAALRNDLKSWVG